MYILRHQSTEAQSADKGEACAVLRRTRLMLSVVYHSRGMSLHMNDRGATGEVLVVRA